jgi:stage II sporulation protein D
MSFRGAGLSARAITAAVLIALLILSTAALPGCLRRGSDDRDQVVDKFESEPTISLYINETGEKTQIKMEEYIAGVVAAEMLPDWPRNAYAAQAILARTFTLAKMSEGGMRSKYGTDMSTSKDETQAYNPGAITDVIREAVAATRGMILVHSGRYVKGWFHAASGGETTLAKDGLAYDRAEPAYTKRVDVPAELRHIPDDELHWRASYSLAEVRSLLNAQGFSLGAINSVSIVQKDPTGRATKVRIEHTGGRTDISGAAFRNALGPDRVRSALITGLESTPAGIEMTGRGFGHGVGMSQWGAYGMAQEGSTPEEIVTYFFKDVEVQKLWD